MLLFFAITTLFFSFGVGIVNYSLFHFQIPILGICFFISSKARNILPSDGEGGIILIPLKHIPLKCISMKLICIEINIWDESD